ncbi:MAG: TetR family transcriptional regulator C-terminal domain-containing protein [Ginsengibacter sp.]
MANTKKIQDSYIDYVLTNGEAPKSVYNFAKELKMTEAEFYKHYASFDAIEKAVWEDLTLATIINIKEQEVWPQYTAREKMLSFFYGYIELLKTKRSFIIYTLNKNPKKITTPSVLTNARKVFESFAEDVVNEGLDSGELADRKYLSNKYKDALWIQFAFIIRFWIEDDSAGFEKTDEAIEKGINVTFDLFQRSPIDNLFEYGKFLTRNGKFKEKMGL